MDIRYNREKPETIQKETNDIYIFQHQKGKDTKPEHTSRVENMAPVLNNERDPREACIC